MENPKPQAPYAYGHPKSTVEMTLSEVQLMHSTSLQSSQYRPNSQMHPYDPETLSPNFEFPPKI